MPDSCLVIGYSVQRMWSGHFSCGVPGAPRDVSFLLREESKKIVFFVVCLCHMPLFGLQCYIVIRIEMLYLCLDCHVIHMSGLKMYTYV